MLLVTNPSPTELSKIESEIFSFLSQTFEIPFLEENMNNLACLFPD